MCVGGALNVGENVTNKSTTEQSTTANIQLLALVNVTGQGNNNKNNEPARCIGCFVVFEVFQQQTDQSKYTRVYRLRGEGALAG